MVGPLELGIIALIVILIFGVGKIGDIGGALGRGIREFRDEVESSKKPEQMIEDNEHEHS